MSRLSSREEQLFAEAISRPAEEWPVFLDRACNGEPELRARVEALLAAHQGTASLRAPRVGNFNLVADEAPGSVIGRYKLLQKIGEGGCGVVWMAEQDEPVRRRVALKVIKPGMDTREVIARFEAERQALAMMDHPGIAKVLDAGTTDSRLPFFVMDLVRGVRITRYCDEQQLDVPARLALFVQVCDAVQHAHQKGIIHRDLKPSNILVSMDQKTASVRVIDFGIAKATQGRLTNATLVTNIGQLIGTPAYMSPEQAGISGLDVDTRSDIYSLGVLLYELLVGHTPFDPDTLQRSSYEEMRRIIREVEPAKPSAQFNKLPAVEREKVARARSADSSALAPLLAGDLDWIVMRALEKSPARRYETAAAFAADINRFLVHEPVVARPPTFGYRLGKSIRRNRLVFAAAGCVVLALVAGLIASTWQAYRARQAERTATAERIRAVNAQARAENLLNFMIGDLRSELQKVGRLELLDRVAAEAKSYFASLDPELGSGTIAQAKLLRQIGEVQLAKGQLDEAEKSFSAAYARAAALNARNPREAGVIFERGQAEYYISSVHRRRGGLDLAGDWNTRYRDSCNELVSLDPANPRWQQELVYAQNNMAVLDLHRGRLAAARQGFLAKLSMLQKMAAENPRDPAHELSMATTVSFLGTVAERSGDFSGALARYRDQAARLEALLARDPKDMERRIRIAVSHFLQIDVLAVTGRRAEARELLAKAIATLSAAVAHDPAHQRWVRHLLTARVKETLLDLADGNLAVGARRLEEIRPKIEKLVSAAPDDQNLAALLVTAFRLEAEFGRASGDPNASGAAARAAERARVLVTPELVDNRILGECAHACLIAGIMFESAGQRDIASEHWGRAVEILKPWIEGSSDWWLLDPASRALALLGRLDESRVLISRLQTIGYRPLQPWPDPVAAHFRQLN